MTGGLIQLVTTGIQDSPLIGNPEVTFFKTVYKQHTMFSLCQNDRYLGAIDFGRNTTKVLEKNGDLLYNQYFKVEIPYFDIVRTISSITKTDLGYNLNELNVTYMNTNCIVLYHNNIWYIVPEKLFNISQFQSNISKLTGDLSSLTSNLLPEYITLTELGSNVNLYQIKDNDVSSLISVLRINSSFWEQLWLNNISTSTDFKMMNQMLTIKSAFGQLYYLIKKRIFNLYSLRNLFVLNSNYMYYQYALVDNNGNNIYDDYGNIVQQNEVERYYNYTVQGNNVIKLNTLFDIDATYKYCQLNFLNFNDYRDNCLQNNPLLFSLMFKLLFATPDLNFTFWKKYVVSTNNMINKSILLEDTHYMNEWQDNMNKYIFQLFSSNNINNMIFEKLKSVYLITEEKINNLFVNLNLDNPSDIYTKLKTFLTRYYLIPYQQINFNNYYLATKYDSTDLITMFNNDEYYYNNTNEINNYPNLVTNINNLDSNEMNNMTPVDMVYIYNLITMDVINLLFQNKNVNKGFKSPIILWRNTITNRTYRKFLDEYKSVVTNGHMLSSSDRQLTLYYSITPSNLFTLQEYKNSYYQMFYKSSWVGRLNLETNNFQRFIESIHKVEINNLFNTDFSTYTKKNFYNLSISNTYNYVYNGPMTNHIDVYKYYIFDPIIYDSNNSYLYVKYDNYYDMNSMILLTIGGNAYTYNSLTQEIRTNELNTNSIYLKFDLSNNIGMSANFVNLSAPQTITLNVTYKTYLPVVTFYKDNMVYNNIQSKRYKLLDKFSNNTVKLLNIVDSNNINIDTPKNGSFNNLMLTINYMETNNIIPPIINSSMIIPTIAVSTNVVDAGMHSYVVTYLTSAGESEMSNIIQVNVGPNMIVAITYMPTDNMNVFGINIYRTKVGVNTFYLVGKLTIEDTIYYDDTSDALLGIDYSIDNQDKLTTLPKKNTKCVRVPIYLEKNSLSYSICNMDGSKYYLPTNYTPIKNIFIDEIKLNETLDESTFYNVGGYIIFGDSTLYSSNYLYYLVNCYNIKDTIKLVLTYNVVNMSRLNLTTVTTSYPSTLTAGTYKYMITIYNSLTTAETLPSPSTTIKINTGDYVKITNFTKYDPGDYDSWNIYRTDGTSDTFYYLNTVFGLEIDVLDGSENYSLTSETYQQPYFNTTKQIYKGSLVNPQIQPTLSDMNITGNIAPGNYMYLYTYYNNNEESLNSTASNITTTNLTQVNITIPAVTVSNVLGVKIYRTKESSQFFYQIANITNITSTITFTDNNPDSNLSILVPKTYKILKVPNYTYVLEKPTIPLTLETVGTGNLTTGTFMYFYTYFTSNSYHDIESEKSPVSNVNIINSMVRLYVPISSNNDVTGRQIYRTQSGGNDFFLIARIEDNITTSWIDNMTDSTLNISYIDTLQNIVPNLNSFMSHSTDVNYANSKNMSDLNDYMFNKPFIMLLNNSNTNQFSSYDTLVNSFNKDIVYFYNIGFKTNETSVITLSGNNVNYMLPISMQQYFVKESNDKYYTIDSNESLLTKIDKLDSKFITLNEPTQRTFNPAFDEFNLTQNFLSNGIYSFYYDAMIDSMVCIIDNILSTNADYNKIINTMESANNLYNNIFTTIFDYNNTNLYGLTSQVILGSIDFINNLQNISSTGTVNYPILNFNMSISAPAPMPLQINNFDFLRYSHYALRLVDDVLPNDSNLVTFKNNILNVLSPVYNYYSSSKKVADNTYSFFNTINKFFIDQITYVNNNIDYLNLSNPANYNDNYLSYPEIIQETYNKFKDYSGVNTIAPLCQLYDSGFYKILLNDKTLTNFSLDGNNIITTDYTQNIQANNYNDTTITNIDRNLYRNNRFNYLGITSIDINSMIIFNDMYINTPFSNTTYYKFDDNKIYTMTPNMNGNRYGLTYELTDNMIINPYELVFNDSTNLQSIILTKFSNNKYIYSYNLTFENTFNFTGTTNFLINNMIVCGTIVNSIVNNMITFIMILNNPLTFNETVLMYEATMGDKTSWQVSSQIMNVSVNNFKIANYYINNSLNGMGINSGDVYVLAGNYYDMSTISEINNICYFNLPASDPTVTINLYNKVAITSSPDNSYVTYNLKPSLIIRGGAIYSYYADGAFTKDILNTDPNYYILLIDTSVGRYFILKISDIKMKQIPKGNYHTYVLPSYSINTIQYDVTNISIDSNGNISGLAANNLPTYSFYIIRGVVYFYTTGDTINIVDSSIAYFNQTNNSMTVYLIDNTLFNTELKQMIGIAMKFNLNENFITKKLNVNSTVSFDSLNYLVYNSRYSNTELVAASYNSNTIQLLGDNEVIVEMLIQNTNMQTLYQPIVIKKYDNGIVVPNINFTYNMINYSKSFIPINSTNLFDSNNKLINNLIIGTINSTDTYVSISPNIIISNGMISLNNGYIVSNLDFELKLWKIKGVTSTGLVYYVYFWILFTNNTHLIQNYLDVLTDTTNNIGISEPLYLDTNSSLTITNYCLQYNLISCYPNILQQSNKDLILLNNTYDTSIYYQFYTDTRHYNTTKYTHILKQLDYNNVINIKPTVEFLANNLNGSVFFSSLQSSDPTVFNSAKYFILVYQRVSTGNREYKVIFKSDVPNNLYFDYDGDISNLTTYYSINYPTFINNMIVLIQNTTTVYQIVKFNNMLLEMNELIILDGNIFIVNGLSLKSNTYMLTLITSSGSTIKDKYNGYFTLGNFLRKDNKVMPPIDYENMLTYKPMITPNIGDIYFSNSMNKFVIATSISSVSDVSIFKESSLTIKLYYTMNGLFLFDNMILLKNCDKLLCTVDNNIYTIKNIRDGMIFLDNNINLASNYNNTFITFILPYQPFKIMYINFDSNGNILSDTIHDNMTILLDSLNVYNVNNNTINTNMTPGYRLVRVMNTIYTSFFENVSFVPISTTTFNISNKYPIILSVNYDHNNNRIQILNNSNIMTNFNFYYFQPIFISGSYNFIKNITFDGTYYWIVLMNPTNIIMDGTMKVTFSPSYTNNKDMFIQTKIRYNFGIQSYDYNNLIGKNIEVVRYILKDNKVVLVQTKLNNNKIIFKYGVSIAVNEVNNKIKNVFVNNKFKGNTDTYESIYFYGNFCLNSDGTINNYDTLLGSYHLICQMNQDFNKVNLCRFIYPNNIFAYQPFNYNYLSKSFLGRIMCIKSNFVNEIVYNNFNMVQSNNILEINNKTMKFIKKYDIRLVDTPTFVNNNFNQEIQFIGANTFSYELYNTIYLDEGLTQPYSIVTTNINSILRYYIVSPLYLSNQLKTIYTILTNYMDSATMSQVTKKNKKLADPDIDYYIDTKIVNTEILLFNMNFSKISNMNGIYKYRYVFDDKLDHYKLNSNETYFIQYVNQKIISVNNNNNTIITGFPLDSDTLVSTHEYDRLKCYTIRNLDVNNIFDPTKLFTNVKALKISLFNSARISDIDIFNKLKPWKVWALLNSILGVNRINSLVNNCYLQYSGNTVSKKTDNISITANYSYLTNNEVSMLSTFLVDINTKPNALANFTTLKNNIEPLILSNLKNWLGNTWFFLNVTNNINLFLQGAGYNNIVFDGNNLIINNMIPPYISNEYTFDSVNNIVYRSIEQYNNINSNILRFINSTNIPYNNNNYFGISIQELLRYLRILGDQFIQLTTNFTNLLNSTPEYPYNNPLKFIINKVWENHMNDSNLALLDKNFQQNETLVLRYVRNSNIYSSINYLINLDISYFGLYSISDYTEFVSTINSQYNMSNLVQYKDTVLKPVQIINKLTVNTLYPYKINFKTNEITGDATYSIDFLNGENIMTDYAITEPNVYPDELLFTSPLNIKPSDFITVKKRKSYNVNSSTFLGYLYSITFNNLSLVDSIYFRNYNLTIMSINNNTINLLVPLSLIELSNMTEINTTDIFEIRNNVSIISTKMINNNTYLTFLNSIIVLNNFVAGKTLLRTPNNIYMLQMDNSNILPQFYITGSTLDSYDCTIINMMNPTNIVNMNQGIYNIILGSNIVNTGLTAYEPVDKNIIIPMDFKYNNKSTSLTPLKVRSVQDNILQFYFTSNDISTINSMTGWNMVVNTKRIGHDLTNSITKLEKVADYAYYFNNIIPSTSSTIIFVYDTTINDIDVTNNVFEPINNTIHKTSMSVTHPNNTTRFTLNTLFSYTDTTDKLSFIQKNFWTLTNYSIVDNMMTITVPFDFVINMNNKYYYKINNTIINKGSFLYDGSNLTFNWNDNTTNGPIIFTQYYVETTIGVIMIPNNNMKVKITLDYPYQYTINDKFYILPYDSNGAEFNNYFYILKTSETTNLNGFGMIGFTDGSSNYTNNIITLYMNGTISNGIIFDEYYDGTSKYLIISLNNMIDTTLSYTYSLSDTVVKNVVSISFYQQLLFTGDTPYQDSPNYIYIYTNSDINSYIPLNGSGKANRFYLIGYYDYKLTNLYYNPVFVQNPNMMKQIVYNTSINTIVEKPRFKTYDKLFSFIRLYFNDQLMEELNEYVFNINYHLYSTEEQRRQLDKMVIIRNNSSYELYIPLIFWFSKKAGMSLPTIALPNTQLRLEYKLNDLVNILDNNLSGSYTYSLNPTCKITLQSEFILLDSMERKLFGSFSHEYVIDRYINMPYNNITNDTAVLVKNWSGLIKDIHFIAEPENYPGLNYFPEITNDYDYQYMRYVTAVKYYNLYQATNYFTSAEQRQYNLDINIISQNTIDLNNYILTNNNVKIQKYIDFFSRWSIWDNSYELLKLILYYDGKYLSFVPDEQKIYSISIYLLYLYSNKINVREVSPVQSMLIKVNGSDLFAERDWSYYTNVVPYQKFKNTLPTGYYTYTFSLHPTDDQHSGHLNFSFFDDIVVKVRSNIMKPDGTTYGPYKLNTILREYNILRIMSGMGNLAWIN